MVGSIDAWKKNVRKVPETRMTMKLYSATSPSMNDQWSGKILRPSSLTMPEMLVRSSM